MKVKCKMEIFHIWLCISTRKWCKTLVQMCTTVLCESHAEVVAKRPSLEYCIMAVLHYMWVLSQSAEESWYLHVMITTLLVYGYYTTASLFPDLCLLFMTECAHLRLVQQRNQLAVCQQHVILVYT